jgi:hypothetical protein
MSKGRWKLQPHHFQIEFNNQVDTATVTLFWHASRQARQWNKLVTYLALDLFAQIAIEGMTRDEQIRQQERALLLDVAMQLNALLLTLHWGHVAPCREQSAALSDGLRTMDEI